jgi:hypothetical protein
MAELGCCLLHQAKHADAEKHLRESLRIRAKSHPDAWTTFDIQSMLGDALLGQKKFAEAEPLLLRGCEGLEQRQAKIPARDRALRLKEALGRLVRLYEATGKMDETARWRKKLDEAKKASAAQKPKR